MKQNEMPRVKIGSVLEVSVRENVGRTLVDSKTFDRNYQIVGYYKGLMENPSGRGGPGEKGICLTSNSSKDGGNNVYISFEDHNIGYSFLVAKKIKVIRKA